MTDQEHRFLQNETAGLAKAGLDDDSLAALMTGGMTLNKAREKLRLPPLDNGAADQLFLLEPYCLRQEIRPAVFHKACAAILNGKTEALRSFRNHIIRNYEPRQLEAIMDLFTDTAEAG